MNTAELITRMKYFGLKGVRDGSAYLFINPDLLAEFVQSEILSEREACAKVCEEKHVNGNWKYDTREECAEAIRSRSN